jgi:hypothetical protein
MKFKNQLNIKNNNGLIIGRIGNKKQSKTISLFILITSLMTILLSYLLLIPSEPLKSKNIFNFIK